MKAEEIRDLTNEEMQQRSEEIHRELFNLRMQQGIGQVENPLRIRELRRDIACINTVLNERERVSQ